MGITPLRRYYEAVRPSPAHRYFQPRGWNRLCFFPWHRRPGSHVPYDSLVDRRIMAWHRSNETSKRLDAIPGVGPALATALVASIGIPRRFDRDGISRPGLDSYRIRTQAAAR